MTTPNRIRKPTKKELQNLEEFASSRYLCHPDEAIHMLRTAVKMIKQLEHLAFEQSRRITSLESAVRDLLPPDSWSGR